MITLVSIHAPRAGRDSRGRDSADETPVSIHAPRAGRDADAAHHVLEVSSFNPRAPRGARQPASATAAPSQRFQSTRPARGATSDAVGWPRWLGVSIHAPRAGRDRKSHCCL